MAFEIRKAERKKAKIKLGVSGPSGAGKTYSALMLARGLANGDLSKVIVIDTENGSSELYSHLGGYSVIAMPPPYGPRNYIEAIKAAHGAGFEVIIVDSASHEWDGQGGCLRLHEELGGKYQDWKRITPQHQAFLDCFLQTPAHFILTLRKKQEHALTQENGKNKVEKRGMKDIQREGFEYELTINFDLEMNHMATASKDRTGVFMPRGPFKIDDSIGKELLEWANSGAAEKIVLDVPSKKETIPEPLSRHDAFKAEKARHELDYIVQWPLHLGKKLSSFSDSALESLMAGLRTKGSLTNEEREFGVKAKAYLAVPKPTLKTDKDPELESMKLI